MMRANSASPFSNMITLRPLPDELDLSLLGRLIRVNGLETVEDAKSLLAKEARVNQDSRDISFMELLGRAAGMDLGHFARNHSTVPFWRGITSYFPELPHGSEERRSMLNMSDPRGMQSAAYLCIDCVREDQDRHGMSYWRRDHQLPGVVTCAAHLSPLQLATNGRTYLDAPARYIDSCEAVKFTLVESALTHGGIHRYLAILRDLMTVERPVCFTVARTALRERAQPRGFYSPGRKSQKLLSDQVLAEFPLEWLATVFPPFAAKQKGIKLNAMDGILHFANSVSSVLPCILACSVLFDSAEDAVRALGLTAVDASRS